MRSSRPASSNPPSPLTLHFSPLRPSHCPRLLLGPPMSCSRCTRSHPSRYCPLPEDPLLPASLVLGPSFPLQLPRMASPTGLGTPWASAGLLHAAALGDSAWGNPLGLLYLTCWPLFSGPLPSPHHTRLSLLPCLFLKSRELQGEGSPLSFPSAAAEVCRFLKQTCISSSTGTLSFHQLPLMERGKYGNSAPSRVPQSRPLLTSVVLPGLLSPGRDEVSARVLRVNGSLSNG